MRTTLKEKKKTGLEGLRVTKVCHNFHFFCKVVRVGFMKKVTYKLRFEGNS